uniref:Uncharacterized protein n=1 Tax=Octopus bimaculoides TaxID=37653 RepID=A0A0L8GCK6_OCTBM
MSKYIYKSSSVLSIYFIYLKFQADSHIQFTEFISKNKIPPHTHTKKNPKRPSARLASLQSTTIHFFSTLFASF